MLVWAAGRVRESPTWVGVRETTAGVVVRREDTGWVSAAGPEGRVAVLIASLLDDRGLCDGAAFLVPWVVVWAAGWARPATATAWVVVVMTSRRVGWVVVVLARGVGEPAGRVFPRLPVLLTERVRVASGRDHGESGRRAMSACVVAAGRISVSAVVTTRVCTARGMTCRVRMVVFYVSYPWAMIPRTARATCVMESTGWIREAACLGRVTVVVTTRRVGNPGARE